ncbi:MAG: hypothetical protein HOI66_14145 [Verrucomicrobia bacterium]|jgi:hypothetical protein|nr:hypothetical protein [Verrucomicrobiota bacterium]
MKNKYILIDYENVQPKSLAILDNEDVRVFVFVGELQSKIPFELASAMQRLGQNAEYVKIGGNGSNALDFHIAFFIGKLSERDPSGSFHIISKDTGFDPLIKHLNGRNILAQRAKTLTEVSSQDSSRGNIDAIVKQLRVRGKSRPRKVKTLANTIKAFSKKALNDTEVMALIDQLKEQNLITIEKDNVSYKQPINQP